MATGPGEQLSAQQGAMLVVSIVLPSAILFLPAISAIQAKEDAWLSAIFATAAGMVMAYLHTALAGRFPGRSLVEFAPTALGWLPGKLVGLLYLWWFLHTGSIIVREFADFMVTAILPTTPLSVFVLVILALSAYAVRHGIEVLARANEVILLVMIISLLGLTLMAMSDVKIDNLQPFLGEGIAPVLRGAYVPAAWMGEVVIATVLVFPLLSKPKQARPVVMGGLALTGLLLSMGAAVTLGAAGSHWTITSRLPMLMTSRVVEVGGVVERMDPVFVGMWVTGNLVKIAIFYYAFAAGCAQWLGLRDYRPLVLPALPLFASLSVLLFENVDELTAFVAKAWPSYSILIFQAGLPLLMLAGAMLFTTKPKT